MGLGGDELLFLKNLYSRCQKFLEFGRFYIHGLLKKDLIKVADFKNGII